MRRTLLLIPFSVGQAAGLNVQIAKSSKSAPEFRQVRPRILSQKALSFCNTSLWRRPPTTLMSQVVAKLVVGPYLFLLLPLPNLELHLENLFPSLDGRKARPEILLLADLKLPSALLPRALKRRQCDGHLRTTSWSSTTPVDLLQFPSMCLLPQRLQIRTCRRTLVLSGKGL